jgi:hypothetical protein
VVSKTSGPSSDTFSGQRILLFMNLKVTEKLGFHLLYKRHFLKGPTDLSVDRYGFGLGYELF